MKVSKLPYLLLLVIPFAFFACAGVQSNELDLAEVQAAIEENAAKFAEALVNGDVETILTYYTDDAIVMAPNAPEMIGLEAIKAGFTQMMESGNLQSFVFNVKEVRIMGDRACDIGNYDLSILLPDGENTGTDNGKYIAIWKQADDGSWKMSIDIWNTSMPPADMAM